MGREATFLLGLLGLLAGAFLGLLAVKLLVPRPPAGAGPDIQTAFAPAPQVLVEPPVLPQRSGSPPASAASAAADVFAQVADGAWDWHQPGGAFFHGRFDPADFAASPPLVLEQVDPVPSGPAEPAWIDPAPDARSTAFAAAPPPDERGRFASVDLGTEPAPARRDDPPLADADPFAVRASWDAPPPPPAHAAGPVSPSPLPPTADSDLPAAGAFPRALARAPVDAQPLPAEAAGLRVAPRSVEPASLTVAAVAAAPPVAAGTYVTRTGDSWWSLAERAYGDGRLYRALFAWNRAVDPRVSLAPGTTLQVPPAERLVTAWPQFVPR